LHDPVEKPVGLCRIEASQFFDGFQGGSPVAGKEVSDPEVVSGVGIFRVDLDGLPKGFNGVVVRLSLAQALPRLCQAKAFSGSLSVMMSFLPCHIQLHHCGYLLTGLGLY
jgi:hypothetical protein